MEKAGPKKLYILGQCEGISGMQELLCHCSDGYITLWICQNPQNYTPQRMDFDIYVFKNQPGSGRGEENGMQTVTNQSNALQMYNITRLKETGKELS